MYFRKLKTTTFLLIASAVFSFNVKANEIVLSTVSPTSDDYALGVVWSNLMAKQGGDNKLTVVDNGTVKGLRKLAKGQVDISIIGSPHYKDATEKSGKFKKDPDDLVKKYSEMRALFAIKTSAAQYVVRSNSDISDFKGFKGKSFAIGRPGGNAGRVTKSMLAAHDIDMEKDADGQYLKYGPALEQMANGSLAGTLVWGGTPHAAIDNASRQMKLKFISPEPSNMDKFRSSISNGEFYVLKKIPAQAIQDAYGGRVEDNGDQYFWTFPFMFVVNKSMSDETAYELTKTLWDNIDEVNKTSLALSLITKDGAVDALSATLHPGAEKYFKESGLL